MAYGEAVLRGTIVGVFALVALGCGDEPTYVEYAEVCGEAGPVRVLELSPGEHLIQQPWKFGERVVYQTWRMPVDAAGEPQSRNDPKWTVWTAGPCGEAPRELASGAETTIFTIERWPDVLLARDPSAGEVRVLDPEGVRPANVVFAEVDGPLWWTELGLMSIEADVEDDEVATAARLLLHPYPQDPYGDAAGPATLLGTVRGDPSDRHLRVFEDFVLAVTPEQELVRIGLGDGAVTTVLTGVAAFLSDDEGRYLLWQDVSPTNNHLLDYPAGKLFLHDRNDGTDVFLGEAVLAFNPHALDYIERGIIYLYLDAIRVFTLPGLGFLDLPKTGGLSLAIDETRWLMNGGDSFSIVDIVTGEATTLYRGIGEMLRQSDQSFDLLQVPPVDFDNWDVRVRAEGPLWDIPYEGEPQRLAARATRYGYRFKDGRRAGLVDIGANFRGTLRLTDPATDAAPLIDEGVVVNVFAAPQLFGDDVVMYSIPDGERVGVWIARMPPAP